MKTYHTRGFSLTEVMIAMAISGLIMTAVLSTVIFITRSSKRVANYNDMETETARSLEVLAREIRMATAVNCTPVSTSALHILSAIRLRVPDEETNPSSPTEYQVDYWFRTEINGSISFVRQQVGSTATKILVRDIDPARDHNFVRYDQAPSNAINDYSTNQLQLMMTIQPNTHGLIAATSQRVISAYFVLRNR